MSGFGQPVAKQTSTRLPITYLEWKPKAGVFNYYDKDTQENKQVNLSEFTILNVGYKLTGWSEKFHATIYSNEAKTFRGPFDMREAKNKSVLFSGEYDKEETKSSITDAGGRLTLSVTVLQGDKIYNLSLIGSAYKAMGDFLNNLGDDKNTHSVKFSGTQAGKKGAITWETPVFKKGEKLTDEQITTATMAYESLYSNQD